MLSSSGSAMIVNVHGLLPQLDIASVLPVEVEKRILSALETRRFRSGGGEAECSQDADDSPRARPLYDSRLLCAT